MQRTQNKFTLNRKDPDGKTGAELGEFSIKCFRSSLFQKFYCNHLSILSNKKEKSLQNTQLAVRKAQN